MEDHVYQGLTTDSVLIDASTAACFADPRVDRDEGGAFGQTRLPDVTAGEAPYHYAAPA